MRSLCLLAVFSLACSSNDGPGATDSGTDSGSADTGTVDTGVAVDSSVDSATEDAAVEMDSGADADIAMDAGSDAAIDAGSDAGSDAGTDSGADAGAGGCGALATRCQPESGRDCPSDLQCIGLDSEGVGICVPNSAICGGIAGALCPAGMPVCLEYTGATGFPCVTMMERDCICRSPDGRDRVSPGICSEP
ncbi:MAG: hypothetical protein AAGE52_28570 [Myxococcota bacterium]